MKANAPERIYCESDGIGNIVKAHNIKWPDDEAENIEYIQTDTFIEKVCEWLKENANKYLYNTGEKGEYIPTCSGKMVDEFRNYMEGE